jgi:hypothetical protein
MLNGYTRMLQAFVLNVSFIFSDVCLQVCLSGMLHVFYTYVTCVLSGCCIYGFFQAFSGVFTSVSDVLLQVF